MDILSCLVGVMLFMVIYTVLELGSTAFQVRTPAIVEPLQGSRRVPVLTLDGTVRVMDADRALLQLLRGMGGVTAEDIQGFVATANQSAPRDDFFDYRLEYSERADALASTVGALDLLVEPRSDLEPGAFGDGSDFAAVLDQMSPREVWLDFTVDEESLDAFRIARGLAVERGFVTGWTPMQVDLPLRYAITARGTTGSLPLGSLAKPQR